MNPQVGTPEPYQEGAELARVISLINGKGGAGKTTLTANLAALFALAGYRTLAIDLDPQGNLGSDLGYNARGETDFGRSLAAALSYGYPIELLRGVRNNLDVIRGGHELQTAVNSLISVDPAVMRPRLAAILYPLLSSYELIFIDTPPNIPSLQELALTASHYALVTTRTDAASMDEGVGNIARVFGRVKEAANVDLTLIGAILFATSFQGEREKADGDRVKVVAATGRHLAARNRLDALLGGVSGITFRSWIRYAEAAADDARDGGQAVHELEAEVAKGGKALTRALRAGQRSLAGSAGTLAGDFQSVAEELIYRVQRYEESGLLGDEQVDEQGAVTADA